MGIVLDSTVLIAAERSGQNPRAVIEQVLRKVGDTQATLSIVTLIELAHGIERANSTARRVTREQFLHQLLDQISVEPITVPIAFRAGKIDAVCKPKACGSPSGLGDRHDRLGTRLQCGDP